MKALEILKNGISFMTMHKDLNPQSREYLESEISQYEEAITELEAPKTCDGCMYYSVDNWNDFVCLHTIPCSRSCDDYYRKRVSGD